MAHVPRRRVGRAQVGLREFLWWWDLGLNMAALTDPEQVARLHQSAVDEAQQRAQEELSGALWASRSLAAACLLVSYSTLAFSSALRAEALPWSP